MPDAVVATLTKEERITSKRLIDKLFEGGNSHSLAAFPLRLVYMPTELLRPSQVQLLVSVPKRCFKRAVKRNRVKRQIREAYRKNKYLIPRQDEKGLALAFIWLDDHLHSSDSVERRIVKLLQRLSERL